MLPSTGYFNGINCPFYENGLCDRPYCHFRHVKKDPQIASDGIESGAILQKLVSAAVQKVLQHTEVAALGTSSQTTVTDTNVNVASTTTKVTYNPTPISELNKIHNSDPENGEESHEQRRKHIPVPYTPRKPTSLPIKRPVETNGSKPFIYVPPSVKYTPGSAENVQTDKYTPPGAVESKDKYLPGTEKELQEYTPDTTQDPANKRHYVPSSDKTVHKNKLLEYKPTKVSVVSSKPSVTYQPTPRSLAPCFSSDEEEPDIKKRKVSTDLNGLDDLGPEFDILDQILDEEKSSNKEKVKEHSKTKTADTDSTKKESKGKKDETVDKKKHSKSNKEKTNDKNDLKKSKHSHHQSNGDSSKEKSESSKSNKTHHKSKSNDKEKSSSEKKEIKEKDKHKHKEKDKKSSHKSSSRDRDKEKKDNKDKSSSEKKKHSSQSSHSPKHSSKHSSSRSSEKQSDSSSQRDSKSKDKHKEKKHKSKEKDKQKHVANSDDNHIEENGTDEEIDLSDADEETIALECMKIFEEYVPVDKSSVSEETTKVEETNDEEYIPTKKRISRTVDKNVKVIPKPSLKPDFKVSAAQAMADRLAKVKEFHNSRNITSTSSETNQKTDLSKAIINTPSIGNSKIRIAHVPYASTLLNAKKIISPAQLAKSEPSTSSTICQTVKKGSQRVAHVPSEKFIDRPGVLEPLASRIPANIRSTYLNMMIDECLKLYISTTDAYARAQNEELSTSKKCSTVQIYKNSAVMTISRLRRELQESNGVKKSSDGTGTQSNSLGTWSIEGRNKKINDNSKEFIGARFFENITKWVLTEEQLKENGFPRPHESGNKGRATIYAQNKQKPPKGSLRTCCRCKKEYTINKKGFAAVKEECIYHPNNKYRVRGEARYQCCSQDATSDGCCVAPCHVYEYVDFDNLKGFVRTLPPEQVKDDYGVYSLDCEMCYTTHGLDLTRITVINSACKVVYETLIKPLHPIIDYNTRYSGITEEQMTKVRTTLIEVQATLLAMFNSKTILVGHSLESDFKALKLIHDTVIDTSVLFPHKMGPPYKRALRNLSSEHLKKIIQNSVEGHDSAEDAMVCMELLHYKLKEDLKTR